VQKTPPLPIPSQKHTESKTTIKSVSIVSHTRSRAPLGILAHKCCPHAKTLACGFLYLCVLLRIQFFGLDSALQSKKLPRPNRLQSLYTVQYVRPRLHLPFCWDRVGGSGTVGVNKLGIEKEKVEECFGCGFPVIPKYVILLMPS